MTILVTGGSGFLGQHLVQRLLSKYQDTTVRTISRNGNAIQKLLVKCHSERLTPIIGDIADRDSTRYALTGVDTVIHLAAMKYIDLCEAYPLEAVTTNIGGTLNILDSFRGNTFVNMSTDKAVEAIGCYGATKLIAEKLVLNQAKGWDSRRYMVIRSGNIFGSTGSVVDKWKQQIRQDNQIDVTDPTMTRFFINVGTLVDFIIDITENGENGSINIPPQRTLTLADLADAVVDIYGNQTTRTRFIGIRPGEKLHEMLFTGGEGVSPLAGDTPKLTSSEIREWLKDLDDG